MEKIALRLNNYWLILCKRKRIFAVSFFAVFLVVILYTWFQAPIYKASCSIKFMGRNSIVDVITSTDTYLPYSITSSILQSLTVRPIIEQVVYDVGLAGKSMPVKELEQVITSVQDSVEAESNPLANIININVKNRDAAMAARIANAIAKAYIQSETQKKSDRERNIRIDIEGQVAIAKEKLNKAEEALKAFKEQREDVSGIATAIQNNIATLEKQREEISNTYSDTYPDALKMEEQIQDLKKELQSLSTNEIEFASLTSEYEAVEKSHRLLQSRLEDALLVEESRGQDLKVVELAIAPPTPIKPKTNLAISIGLISGMLLGVFIVFVAEAFKL